MIADVRPFGNEKSINPLRLEIVDKKAPPGGERFRGGANKGTGILRMETIVPRQLVKFYSNHRAKIMFFVIFSVNCRFGGVLCGLGCLADMFYLCH